MIFWMILTLHILETDKKHWLVSNYTNKLIIVKEKYSIININVRLIEGKAGRTEFAAWFTSVMQKILSQLYLHGWQA